MTIWLLTIVVLASTIGMGYGHGWIRASFSFLGILFATALAVPIGHIFQPILMHVGVDNETMAWLIAPIVAFPVVLTIFKLVGGHLARKQEVHFKHKASELEYSIWNRLYRRLGACMGVLNGSAYVVLICFVIFNFSYWTVQVAASDNEAMTTRLINRLGEDAQSTGITKTAGAIGTLPDNYYNAADLAGLICQNPDLSYRLARYPAFLSLIERDDIQALANDFTFTNAWATHAPMGQILNHPGVQRILKNNELLKATWNVIEPNLGDLVTYLRTGSSPKYDSEPLLGFWDIDVRVTFAYERLGQSPKITPGEIAASRNWMYQAYSQVMLIVSADNQAFLRMWPDLKSQPQPGQPPGMISLKGTWSKNGNNYTFNFPDISSSPLTAEIKGPRLFIHNDKHTYVFNPEM